MSLPKTITRPNAPLYSVNLLFLYEETTYEQFKAANAGAEPPCDPNEAPRHFCDERYAAYPPEMPVTYFTLDKASKKLVPVTTTAGKMATLNIFNPGGDPGIKMPISQPWNTEAAAKAVQAIIGGSIIDNSVGFVIMPGMPAMNPDYRYSIKTPEMRRPEFVTVIAKHMTLDNPSTLQSFLNDAGIKVDVLTAGQAHAAHYAAEAALPHAPLPIADLLPNEELVDGTFPGDVFVHVKDSAPAINNTQAGGLTADQSAKLDAIYAAVVK